MAQKKVTESDDLEKRKKSFFKQRFPGFKKKATELRVLCGNSVGFICYGPDKDNLHVWPENPQALQQIVSKFNGQSHQKRKKHGCDLNDFPHFEGFSVEELKTHLSDLESHLVGVRRKKIGILKKTIKASSSHKISGIVSEVRRPRVSENADQKSKDMVSEDLDPQLLGIRREKISIRRNLNPTISDRSGTLLGFGGVFDELGYVVRGSDQSVSNLVSKDVVGVSRMEADSSRMDPFTYNSGFCSDDGIWDLEFLSTPPPLATYDWMVSGQTPNTYQTPNVLGLDFPGM